ncbi:MAG: TonB-dependent receptor [Bacteroidia bacterium]|nr:TonB-dependent receptor [Bacteroidia bacterium]
MRELFRPFLILSAMLILANLLQAQTGTVSGRVYDENSNAPLEFAAVQLVGTNLGAFTDSLGRFAITQIPPGLYDVQASYGGYENLVAYEVQVSNSKPYVLELGMRESTITTDSVDIVATPFKRIEESPLSLRTISTSEIKRNPGGNRDISRVIQSLPGVASTPSFRNDILIRGGSPNENRFYIDGIEVPNINHFATQGASGGPVGLINVDFIGEVDFYSGAFPANRGNALSSVFEFRQREARNDRLGFTATVGPSDLALTVEGPTGENSSFLFSVRRSYLELLFKALALPFLPAYNDYQYKHKIRLGQRHEINIISLGALDDFSLNLGADSTAEQRYILNYLPVQTQWNYTIGATYKYFGDRGFWTVVASRNMLNNRTFKYPNNDENLSPTLDYISQEIENKARIEYTARKNGWKLNAGVNYEFAKYTNDTYQVLPFGVVDFESSLDFHKYGAFAQVSKSLLKDRLTLSLGTRMDGNSYSEEMQKLWKQFSPRFSASYAITPKLSANFNTGIFYQLPPYTVLGYRDTDTDELVNKNVSYIRNRHVVAGFAYDAPNNARISIEGYYKTYENYPLLLRDSISLANIGGDFGVVGNEAVASINEGRTYGMEILVQQRFYKGFYGILAYTLGWSEFQDKNGVFVPSSWDSRHIVALTAGKKFKGDWELGAKWRFTTGSPFTPNDQLRSSLRSNWDVSGLAVPDFNLLNTQRLNDFHQLDLRIDKKWFFRNWSFNLFLDVQNVYFNTLQGQPFVDVVRDDNLQPVVDPNDPSRYQTYLLDNQFGIVQPTLGIIVTY